mmetsp:Transcript_39226/g.124487  ORF Transcript_39226/g.124487 Transcript_39226/m.124487 type:complete len:307 (-) Transcript_39226:174-1094(-)
MAGSAVVFQDPVEVVVDVLKHQVVLRHADNPQVDEAHDVGVREVAQDGHLAHNDRGHSIAIVVELQLLDRDCLPSRPVNRLVDSAEDTEAEKLSPVIFLREILFISIPASADQLRRGTLRRSHVVMVGLPARTILSRILGRVRLRRQHSFFAVDHLSEHALLPGGHRSRGRIDQGVARSLATNYIANRQPTHCLVYLLKLCHRRLFLRSRFKQNTLWRSCPLFVLRGILLCRTSGASSEASVDCGPNDRGHSVAVVVEPHLLGRGRLPSLVDRAQDTRSEKLPPVMILLEIFMSMKARVDQLRSGR